MAIAYSSKCLDYTVYGKSEQDGTPTPENPIEIKTIPSVVNLFDGITTKQVIGNTGGIASNSIWDLSDYIKVKPSESYTLWHNDNTSIGQSLMIIEYNNNKEFIKRDVQGSLDNSTKPYTITTDSSTAYVRINYNNTYNNSLFQFEQGSTAHPYVPYGYYLRIDDVGKNLLSWNNDNLGLTDQNAFGTDTNYISSTISTKDYTNLTINGDYSQLNGSIVRTAYSNQYPAIGVSYTRGDNLRESSNTLVVDKRYNYITFMFLSSPGRKETIKNTFMLEQGTEATPYEPYREPKTYFIDLAKKNLFDANLFGDFTTSLKYIQLNLKPNTYYTMTSNIPYAGQNANLFFYKSGESASTSQNGLGNGSSRTLRANDDGIVNIAYRDGDSVLNNPKTDYYYRLYEGSTTEDHYELCSIGDVRDELIVENGYAKIEKKIGKLILNGTESWSRTSTEQMPYITLSDAKPFPDTSMPNVLCNYYIPAPRTGLQNGQITISKARNMIIYDNANATNLNDWKAYIKSLYDNNSPIIIYYELETPYTAGLGQVDFPIIDGEIKGIAYNGKEVKGVAYGGKTIFTAQD